jgi:hypothetical protein
MSNIIKNQELSDSGISIGDSEQLARPGPKSAAQTPAPPKERIKGSKDNPEGTAATRSKAGDIEISEANEQALKEKIAEFIKDHPQRKVPSLGTLKKVFRRGAGAFSTSFRPTISGGQPNSRNAWAMARVNKFLKMAGGGEVKESYRKADGDLLEERFEDCGTGAGGFKPGNTCASGGGETATEENNSKVKNKYKSFIDEVDSESVKNKEKIIFIKDGKKISEARGTEDRANLTEDQKEILRKSKGDVSTIHNHPKESIPSDLDVALFAGSGGEHIISTPASIYKIDIDKKTEDEARQLAGKYSTVNYKIQKELNQYLADRFPRKMGGGSGLDGFSYRNNDDLRKAQKAEKRISENIFSDFAKDNGFSFSVIDK